MNTVDMDRERFRRREEARANRVADAADELVRLRGSNAQLLEALQLCKAFTDHGPSSTRSASRCKEAYDAAIGKATEGGTP